MNANNKLKKRSMKIIITMMLAVVFLIGQIFSPFAILANADSTQTIKVIVKDADTGQRINGANVTFNGPGGSGDKYSGTSGIDGICYIDVHNGSEKQVGITVNKDEYGIWNVYDSNYYIKNGSYNKNLVIKGSWKDNHKITIELKKNSTTSNTTSSTIGSKPNFTVTMDSYTPTNPSVGGEITFTGTIHPQDFEIPMPAKEIVLVLDSSGSMNGTKIEKLKDAATKFITKMKDIENLKIGIVDFDTQAVCGYGVHGGYTQNYTQEAGYDGSSGSKLIDASNVTALTSTINNLKAGGGTNTGESLRQAAYLLSSSSEQSSTASKTIVFMSDGEPTFYNWKYSYYNQSAYYTDVTTPNFGYNVSREGGGSTGSDTNNYSLNYAKTIGAIIKDKGYNVFSIGYGLDDSGTTKMQQIHDSMTSVSDNFFESDTDSIDNIFDLIANTISDTYPITDIKFNFNGGTDNNVISVDGNTISLPDFNYRKVDETTSTVKYTADPVSFNVKVKSNIVGNDIPVFTNSTVTFPWKSETITANVPIQYINIGNIDNTPPELTLTKTDPTNGSVEITARATDNVAVASITTPDNNTVSFEPAAINSTTYTVTMNGDYIFKATDTAGNVTTSTINVNNIVSVNVASKPRFTVTMDSYLPTNPSVGDEITFNGTIHPEDFQISIPEKEIVLVLDSSGSMGNNLKLYNLKVAAKNFIDKMKNVENLKIGIVDFDTQSLCGSKLIDANNVTALNSAIDNLKAAGGTNTGEGLRLGTYLLSNSPEQNSTASKTIVFMSDGEPTYYNSKNNQYYTDITQQSIDNSVQRKGTGSSDANSYCLNYAKTIGSIIKEEGYNVFSIGYGLDTSGTTKMQQIHNSMSSVSDNFFESDTDSIDSVFDSIGNTILDSYPITDIKFNFNGETNTNIISVDGNTISIPDFNYTISSQTTSTVKYTADPVSFTVKIKSNIEGNHIQVFTDSTVTFPWENEIITGEVPEQYINVGNIVNIDNTPPTLTLRQSTKDLTTGKVTITAEAEDRGSGVASITNVNDTDGKPQGTVTNPANSVINNGIVTNLDGTLVTDSIITYTVSADGTYQFTATDNAGNVTTQSIKVDVTDPTLILTQSAKDPQSGKVTITAEAEDSGSGVASITNLNDTDGKPQGTVTNPTNSLINNGIVTNLDGTLVTDSIITYTVSADGTYQFTAKDNAGNVTTKSITIDITAPDAPVIIGNPPNGTNTNDKVTITINYSTDSAIKEYRIDGGDWQAYNGSFDVTENCIIQARGTDAAGNKSEIASYSVTNIYAPSIISKHGLYNGNGTNITEEKDLKDANGNPVTTGIPVADKIPVTLAMIVEANSSNPVINLSTDTSKITQGTIEFKMYKISDSDDGTIDTNVLPTIVILDNTGNINLTGLTMERSHKYLIVYTITPYKTTSDKIEEVNVTATADGTNTRSVNLNILAQPDLF